MANTEIEVNVKVIPNVDLKTAETCLKIVELYMNNHSGIKLAKKKEADGRITLDFECCCESKVLSDG